jgi:hypothetical protein
MWHAAEKMCCVLLQELQDVTQPFLLHIMTLDASCAWQVCLLNLQTASGQAKFV